jgi:hypothetical protein
VCDEAQDACVHTPVDCNDNDPCTLDTCDSMTGCVHTPINQPTAPTQVTSNRDHVCPGDGMITLTAAGWTGDGVNWFINACELGVPLGSGNPLTIPAPTATTTYCAQSFTECGTSACVCVTVNVDPVTTFQVNVQLQATIAAGPITRCIRFEVWPSSCTAPILKDVNVTFGANGDGPGMSTVATGGGAVFTVPCGSYVCLTARDRLHTLRRTVLLGAAVNNTYTAAFMATGGKDLKGGNLNDDAFIDILDFGIFASQYFGFFGSGNTPCGTAGPQADINGDTSVNTGDFSFIQINFLSIRDANCCGGGGFADQDGEPVTDISVADLQRRGLGSLALGDLNNDGRLNAADIAAFLLGERPRPPADDPDDKGRPRMSGSPAGSMPGPRG